MNLKDIYVALPWYVMEKYFDLAYPTGLNLEFGLSSDVLDHLQSEEVEKVADLMRNKGLSCTIHAPSLAFSAGALDTKILEVTRLRFQQAMYVARMLRPKCIVFHTGFDMDHYCSYSEYWLRESIETWKGVMDYAEKLELKIAVENVFDTNPNMLKKIISSI